MKVEKMTNTEVTITMSLKEAKALQLYVEDKTIPPGLDEPLRTALRTLKVVAS